MKTISKITSIVLTLVFSFTMQVFAGDKTQTEKFKVWGNCNMCKKNIEKAAKIEGVTKAEWDVKTKMMTVSFDPNKTNTLTIQKFICVAGYDNEVCHGDDVAYDKLNKCCKYDRKK